jgi:ubiquitin carboxyl-terminal hydrolase L3
MVLALMTLDGGSKGPLDRGLLGESDDVLSEKALQLGLKRIMKLDQEASGGDLLHYHSALEQSRC